jgi:type VI secretion system protein ImpM
MTCGFYGKLPTRGDFLRGGLPRSFLDPWDAWLQSAVSQSRDMLGNEWEACWLEAPIWRFCLPDGKCGPDAILGLWMPSVDRAGRYFPLTLARLCPGAAPGALATNGAAWLDGAEAIGLDALENDGTPDGLAARLEALAAPAPSAAGGGAAMWWTAGSPFVAQVSLRMSGLPSAAQFATMLQTPPAPDPVQSGDGFLEAT